MNAPQHDAHAVAVAELWEAANSAGFYSQQVKGYLEQGDLTGVKRSKLMVEQAAVRMRVAWTILDELETATNTREAA